MSGELDRSLRFDLAATFDVGSYGGQVTGGAGGHLTLLSPPLGGTQGISIGADVIVSGYFTVESHFVDLTPDGGNAEKIWKCPVGEAVSGVRIFTGLVFDIPLSDIVSLRLSPGTIIKHDNIYGWDSGAAVVSALVVDLPASAVFMLYSINDVYTRFRNEQFIFGAGFGINLI